MWSCTRKNFSGDDLNKEIEEKEFRIPMSDGNVYRFKVTYSKEKWSVETLPALKSSVSITGALAEKVFKLSQDEGRESSWAQANLSCLKPEGIETPACFKIEWKTSKVVDGNLSKEIYQALNDSVGLFTQSYSVDIQCQKPNEWSDITELTCTLKAK